MLLKSGAAVTAAQPQSPFSIKFWVSLHPARGVTAALAIFTNAIKRKKVKARMWISIRIAPKTVN